MVPKLHYNQDKTLFIPEKFWRTFEFVIIMFLGVLNTNVRFTNKNSWRNFELNIQNKGKKFPDNLCQWVSEWVTITSLNKFIC